MSSAGRYDERWSSRFRSRVICMRLAMLLCSGCGWIREQWSSGGAENDSFFSSLFSKTKDHLLAFSLFSLPHSFFSSSPVRGKVRVLSEGRRGESMREGRKRCNEFDETDATRLLLLSSWLRIKQCEECKEKMERRVGKRWGSHPWLKLSMLTWDALMTRRTSLFSFSRQSIWVQVRIYSVCCDFLSRSWVSLGSGCCGHWSQGYCSLAFFSSVTFVCPALFSRSFDCHLCLITDHQ